MTDSIPPDDTDDVAGAGTAAPPETDVTRVEVDGREIILVGTAHISQESVETVQRVIEYEAPDTVCVELDSERLKTLTEEQNWEELDLIEVIKNRQLTFLMARLALMAFQKRMGSYTGVKPGAEMRAAVEQCRDQSAKLELVDRNVRATLLRAWRLTPFWRRTFVAVSLLAGIFDSGELDEEDLAELRQSPNITQILDELGEALPSVKTVLVDERDLYMAHKIRNAPGERIVAIVGAAHVPGLLRHLAGPDTPEAADAVEYIPPRSRVSRFLPWLIPAIVIAVFVFGFFFADPQEFQTAAIAWVLANGTFSAIGAIAALAHPLTIIAAFIAAPITSLNPTIGAGMVCAFVQTIFCAPRVLDMESIGEDITEWKGWWKNRLSRIFVVFFFTAMGSTIGTFVAFGWLKNLV